MIIERVATEAAPIIPKIFAAGDAEPSGPKGTDTKPIARLNETLDAASSTFQERPKLIEFLPLMQATPVLSVAKE